MRISQVLNYIKDWIKDFFTSSNKPRVGITLTAVEITDVLFKKGITRDVVIRDSSYACPQKQWLLYPYYNYYVKILKSFGVASYRSDWDCDDFASLYANVAQICHRKMTSGKEGLAVGECYYKKENGEYHAVNVAIVENNDIVFVEPQTGGELELNSCEKASIFFLRF